MNEYKSIVEITPCVVIFLLPIAFYELRVAWFYFKHRRIITPLGYLFMSLLYKFLPGTIEDYMDWVKKEFNWKSKTLAILSAIQGLFCLLVIIISVISSIVY
jgi:hypothetical protein